MRASIHFNINEYVKIRLNEIGLKILKDRHDELYSSIGKLAENPWSPPKTDEDGFVKMQMWSVMQTFGPHVGLGFRHPFEMEIIIEVP